MIDRLKKKIINILDLSSDKLPLGFFSALVVITSVVTKKLEFNFLGEALLISGTVLMALGTVVQIVRKQRNRRKIVFYLGATIFCFIMTITAWLIDYYAKVGNNEMLANTIKIFLSVLAIIVNIIGTIFIKNKENPKSKRIFLIICMVYFNLIAICAIVFLPPKGI